MAVIVRYSTSFLGPFVVAVRYNTPKVVITVNRFLIGSAAARLFGRGWFAWQTYRFWGRSIR